jgi:hypothetical protein
MVTVAELKTTSQSPNSFYIQRSGVEEEKYSVADPRGLGVGMWMGRVVCRLWQC